MPKYSKMPALALALAAMTNWSSAAQAFDPYAPADPAVALRDFNETCAKGFPDLDAVERAALASGWRPSEMRGPVDLVSEHPPKAFFKDGALLFLTRPESGLNKAVCQIGGSGQTKLTGADLAALATPALNVGAPIFEKTKDKDAALYTTGPGLSVEASIAFYRKSRSISIIARQAR